MKSVKSFDAIRIGGDGKLTLGSAEQIEIARLKETIIRLETRFEQEREINRKCMEKLAQALRGIKVRDERQPIGYLCFKTLVFSKNRYSQDDIEVYDRYDRFKYLTI